MYSYAGPGGVTRQGGGIHHRRHQSREAPHQVQGHTAGALQRLARPHVPRLLSAQGYSTVTDENYADYVINDIIIMGVHVTSSDLHFRRQCGKYVKSRRGGANRLFCPRKLQEFFQNWIKRGR